ncbi:MAG: SH3 domain-containing protein [Candidatus Carbobacillus altaicus]|nr:SH3 domain-containing protein [Candidatus Carbobacillus altaicus]
MAGIGYEPGRPMRTKKRRSGRSFFIWGIIFLFMAVFFYVLFGIWTDRFGPFVPNRTYEPQDVEGSLVFDGKLYADMAIIRGDEPMIALPFLKDHIDPSITYDASTESIYIVRDPHVLRLSLSGEGVWDELTKAEPFSVEYPIYLDGTIPYVPVSLLERLYPVKGKESPFAPQMFSSSSAHSAVFLWSQGEAVLLGTATAPENKAERWLRVRKAPSVTRPYVKELQTGEAVIIIGEEKGWYHIWTKEGVEGYVPKEGIGLDGVHTVQSRMIAPYFSETKNFSIYRPLSEKIVLVWEHVVNKTPDPKNLPELPGVNVLAPTWFELKNESGELLNRASIDYVHWAHTRDIEVHGVLTNGFDPDRTHAMLTDRKAQGRLIQTLLEYANVYELDGINIDFENIYYKDQTHFTQFVREMTAYLHAAGLTVSIDVTVKSSNENWSKVYDRKALGEIVDYVALMAYDEHWATSPVAGSVASLPWVEQGIQGLLEDVPPEKVLLGVPFYARLWQETTGEDGEKKLKQKALSMTGVENWLKDRHITPVWDEQSGQFYAEWIDPTNGDRYKLWLEDESSLRARAELVRKYRLAGLAAWRRGLEDTALWPALAEVARHP